jgi:hypothetical protein
VFGSVEILSLFILFEGNEGDPLSPPEGEAAQGELPLDLFSLFLPSLKRISRQPHEGHRIFMNASTGAEEKGYRSSKKRQNNFSMISKKPFF